MGSKASDNFENTLKQLELIVEKLESGKLGLEDGLKEFEEGVKLYKKCKEFMDKAEKKISVLTESLKTEEYV